MNLKKLGVWASTESYTAPEAAAFAKRVEAWGYGVLWMPEAMGRNPFPHAAWLLANTTTLIVATGIANIYGRDPMAASSAQKTLNEQSGGRFLLGLGVSHSMLVEGLRGQHYGKPVETMRTYLEAMRKAIYMAPAPAETPKTVIAALGPKMLALAAEHADGAHPYNVTPAHTAAARKILGPGKLLCPEQMVLAETDPARARAKARDTLAMYLTLPNYVNNWRREGFGDADFADGGSDRLIDALVAWGDEAAIRARIQAHWDGGADHVCIQALGGPADGVSDEALLERFAPGA
ncbi:MAG TPA: TIGR03620 family F420-dependent LLM class oxidoreductase [Acetobacteraceae bacterium]|nr:TIGR03620 family F420-dependent LLM class oxidoreductase [Acetobacteraceae bacterium]